MGRDLRVARNKKPVPREAGRAISDRLRRGNGTATCYCPTIPAVPPAFEPIQLRTSPIGLAIAVVELPA